MKIFYVFLSILLFSFELRAQSEAKLNPVLSGFSEPTDLTCPFDGTDRLFVAEKAGRIKIIQNDVMIGTFLDIRDKVSSNSERGLLGIAFHPDYRENGYIFISYTGLGPDNDFNSYISRFQVLNSDANQLDINSEEEILIVNQPYANHNGGNIEFGPDGFLYIGFGDGGSGGDPKGSGQNLNSYLGKILRIDVNGSTDSTAYAIPSDNPFIDDLNIKKEIWAYGLRNPWKFSFDRMTGDLWIGDVGQSDREEISVIPSGVGGLNFGWRCFEGELTFGNCSSINHEEPVYTYARPDKQACSNPQFCGKSVTGGYVYRGTENPALLGKYFFADYASNQVWSYSVENGLVERLEDIGNASKISTFGENQDGEIYIVSLSGTIYKLEQTTTTPVKNVEGNEIFVIPNPFKDRLIVQVPGNGFIQLHDIHGNVLYEKQTANLKNHPLAIDLSTYPAGNYYIRFLQMNQLIYKKLIKQ